MTIAPEIRATEDSCQPTVLELYGEHDMASAPMLEDALRDARRSGRGVVVDLSNVDYVDSSVIQLLFATESALQAQGRRLAVQLQTAAVVRKVLDITDFPKACIASTREDALQLAAAEMPRHEAG